MLQGAVTPTQAVGPLKAFWMLFAAFFRLSFCQVSWAFVSLNSSLFVDFHTTRSVMPLFPSGTSDLYLAFLLSATILAAILFCCRFSSSDLAMYDEYYELGVLLIRKKLFATALKHLDSAKRQWEGDEEGLAQLYNAMGYAYLQQDKLDSAIEEYKGAIDLRPNYLVAWNNLGDAYKKTKDYESALDAYKVSINIDPSNKVAQEQVTFLKNRVNRLTK